MVIPSICIFFIGSMSLTRVRHHSSESSKKAEYGHVVKLVIIWDANIV